MASSKCPNIEARERCLIECMNIGAVFGGIMGIRETSIVVSIEKLSFAELSSKFQEPESQVCSNVKVRNPLPV